MELLAKNVSATARFLLVSMNANAALAELESLTLGPRTLLRTCEVD
jgi:hypothetical protein